MLSAALAMRAFMEHPDQASLDRFNASLTEDGRYRLLVEGVTDYAIYMLSLDGDVTSWNAGAQRIEGYEAAEIIGHHFSRFYTAEDRRSDLPKRTLATALREGRFEGEGWHVRKDGTPFWAHVVIDVIRAPTGTPVGFAKITRDLTERRIAEEALRQSEQQFRLLVQSVTDYSIYMLDPNGVVASWNAGAERIKGYAPDEIIGQHFSHFYTAEDRENGAPQVALDTAARDGRFEREGWRVRKDGTRFWAHVIIDAIHDPAGKLVGFAKITRDITERREAQIALETAREALFRSQKMDSLGQLTGGIAHDFNNLLAVILGSLGIARRRVTADADGKVIRLIDNAIRGAQRGAALTQRMLAFARRQELKLEPVDVPALVRGMTELMERSLGPTYTIETRFPLGLRRVMADPNQLDMALLNLAVNARDAMPQGGFIVLAARPEMVSPGHPSLKPGMYICLSVTDTGEGMDETTLARAMEPFFTTKELGKGTGLGLPMVHGLAEQSGGRVVLKSRKGEGTVVELWLPAAEATVPAVASAPAQEDRAVVARRPLTVLVVDDDNLVLTSISAMLEDFGHRAIEASSGQQALATLRQEGAIELVITDYAMPQMTGLQLIGAIEAEWPDLPVILASGYAELPSEASALRPRLAKPFLQHALMQAVDDATMKHGERRVVNLRPHPERGEAKSKDARSNS
jgi:PAS domain S-box-containing protein